MTFDIRRKGIAWLLLALSVSGFATAEELVHSFDKNVQQWIKVFEDPSREQWQKPNAVVSALRLRTGDVVADIGAGSGYFTRRFANVVGKTGKVYAVDIVLGMLDYINQRAKKEKQGNIQTILADADDPKLPPDSVNLVFICNTIHHIGHREAYYPKLLKAMKPDARLVIVDFEKKKTPVGPPMAYRIAREDMVREMESNGFSLQNDVKLLPYQYFLIFGKKEK